MIVLYNLAYLVFALFYLPIFLIKVRQAESGRALVRERLGMFSPEFKEKLLGKKIIWVHAVSVGEVLAVQKFVQRYTQSFQEYHVVLTTVTPTGQQIAKNLESSQVTVCYFPFDLTGAVRSFLKTLQPKALLLVETEIWPNLLMEAKREGVPVGILNARLSERSAKSYYKYRFFFGRLFRCLSFVFTQTDDDYRRFNKLGVSKQCLRTLGNMKFDNFEPSEMNQSVSQIREEWGFSDEDIILVAGSTHPGEETVLAENYERLLIDYPKLKMIIAPRHIERCPKLAKTLAKYEPSVVLSSKREKGASSSRILILDELGILKNIYAIADLVFVGGSLIKHGGQNPIEPANFAKAVIHGPHISNFLQTYKALDSEGGAILVRDEPQLEFALQRLLRHETERKKLGENAFQIVQKLRGATDRHIQYFANYLINVTTRERNSNAEINENLFSTHR